MYLVGFLCLDPKLVMAAVLFPGFLQSTQISSNGDGFQPLVRRSHLKQSFITIFYYYIDPGSY